MLAYLVALPDVLADALVLASVVAVETDAGSRGICLADDQVMNLFRQVASDCDHVFRQFQRSVKYVQVQLGQNILHAEEQHINAAWSSGSWQT